jgi:hypothetical protein
MLPQERDLRRNRIPEVGLPGHQRIRGSSRIRDDIPLHPIDLHDARTRGPIRRLGTRGITRIAVEHAMPDFPLAGDVAKWPLLDWVGQRHIIGALGIGLAHDPGDWRTRSGQDAFNQTERLVQRQYEAAVIDRAQVGKPRLTVKAPSANAPLLAARRGIRPPRPTRPVSSPTVLNTAPLQASADISPAPPPARSAGDPGAERIQPLLKVGTIVGTNHSGGHIWQLNQPLK